MTHEKIIALANDAAVAAHDLSDGDFTPSAWDAYDFIRDQAFNADDQTDEQSEIAYRALMLTEAEFPVYSAAFRAKLAELRANAEVSR